MYLLAGAGIFHWLEYNHEESMCNSAIVRINEYKQKFNASASFNDTDFLQIIKLLKSATDNGVVFNKDGNPQCAHNWQYDNAIFFAGTVITTIGYGNISPNTRGGKTFTVFFALLGIPLFGIMFLAIGDKFAKLFKKLDKKLARKLKKKARLRSGIVLLLSMIFLACLFMLIPSIPFHFNEGWQYPDAVYYTFITLTTIGFGDFVVGSDPDIHYPPAYRVWVYFWIIFGLAGMSTVINLVGDFINPASKQKEEKKKELSDSAEKIEDKPKQVEEKF